MRPTPSLPPQAAEKPCSLSGSSQLEARRPRPRFTAALRGPRSPSRLSEQTLVPARFSLPQSLPNRRVPQPPLSSPNGSRRPEVTEGRSNPYGGPSGPSADLISMVRGAAGSLEAAGGHSLRRTREAVEQTELLSGSTQTGSRSRSGEPDRKHRDGQEARCVRHRLRARAPRASAGVLGGGGSRSAAAALGLWDRGAAWD
uniref:Uncharacterized protein n=1 Tax=Pipistrellus kuhlii TaxID=59472 RepID=A0A7J7U9Z5_PIPKU|nr:hypothetical protein mPipKuh1_009163 [Pipistrellus kuhlii]